MINWFIILMFNTHAEHLTEMMELLEKHQLYAKKRKCVFGVMQVEYIGHIISGEGVKIDSEKITSMVEWY